MSVESTVDLRTVSSNFIRELIRRLYLSRKIGRNTFLAPICELREGEWRDLQNRTATKHNRWISYSEWYSSSNSTTLVPKWAQKKLFYIRVPCPTWAMWRRTVRPQPILWQIKLSVSNARWTIDEPAKNSLSRLCNLPILNCQIERFMKCMENTNTLTKALEGEMGTFKIKLMRTSTRFWAMKKYLCPSNRKPFVL